MFEIDNPVLRTSFLGKVGGIENYVYIQVAGDKIKAIPEKDIDRTSTEGKASSVQFVHFNFNEDQIKKFKNNNLDILIGINHKEYSHFTKISEKVRTALTRDFY